MHSSDPQDRLYRSGDLGRWRADGQIEFLGRNDSQVKLRGFRIELGEIEARLSKHPQVREAVAAVLAVESGEKRLVAYFVPRGLPKPTPTELRDHLSVSLPEYMIPSAIVALERMPITANGKLDRRALPAPEIDAYASRAHESPQGEVEQIVAEMWRELLHIDPIGRHDNFFELGGHSLLAMQVTVRVRSVFSVELSINSVFEFPTLRQLAAQVEQLRTERLLDEIAEGNSDIDALIAQVASMPETRVRELMRELRSGGRQ